MTWCVEGSGQWRWTSIWNWRRFGQLRAWLGSLFGILRPSGLHITCLKTSRNFVGHVGSQMFSASFAQSITDVGVQLEGSIRGIITRNTICGISSHAHSIRLYHSQFANSHPVFVRRIPSNSRFRPYELNDFRSNISLEPRLIRSDEQFRQHPSHPTVPLSVLLNRIFEHRNSTSWMTRSGKFDEHFSDFVRDRKSQS